MNYFKIIIPNYNNSEYIGKCLESIENQTFTDFRIIVIDDVSTDNSIEIVNDYINKYANITLIQLNKKHWNGGSRNCGISLKGYPSVYTLFIDSDDWFVDNDCLQTIFDITQANGKPDCVSLSYNCLIGKDAIYQPQERNNLKDLVSSLYVACWTKCIKSELVQLFPENTLMEDVVQHIRQCDVLTSFASCSKPIVCWNRNNSNSCSKEENQNLQQGKWQSSMYRYAADLMDTHCNTQPCEEHRKWRLEVVLNNIKDGKYIQ